MPVEYRKAGNRTFYRIEGETVVKIVNCFNRSFLEIHYQNLIMIDTARDPEYTKPSTAEEFNLAYSEAMERITKMKIV